MRLKKVAAVLLTGAMLAGALTGCGRDTKGTDNGENAAGIENSGGAESTAQAGDEIIVVLLMWLSTIRQRSIPGFWWQGAL